MNNLASLFLGIFAALAFSWSGIVLANHLGYGRLGVVVDPATGEQFPAAIPGAAVAGREVYRDLGCVYCHSQQVRHLTRLVTTTTTTADGRAETVTEVVNPDIDRGWGQRPSVARDYVREPRVYLGTMRTGPDLRNVGPRYSAEWQHLHLWNPQLTSQGSVMPPYPFLYEVRPIAGAPSPRALKVPGTYVDGSPVEDRWRPPPGHEIVPTTRAENLVAYLLSLHDSFGDFPEVKTPGFNEPPGAGLPGH